MSAERTEAKSGEEVPHKRRRLKLMESYGAFSDDRLRDVAEKIRGMTAPDTPTPSIPDEALPAASGVSSGDPIGESIGETIGDQTGTPIESPIERPRGSPDETPVDSPHISPIERPHGSPDETPVDSPHPLLSVPSDVEPAFLTENQAVLYFCIKNLAGVVTSLNRIAAETGISEHTLKSCLKKLTKDQLILYGGRRNCGGRIGFTAQALHRNIVLRGNKSRLLKKLQQINYLTLPFVEPLEDFENYSIMRADPFDHPVDHRMDHRMENQTDHLLDSPLTHRISNPLSLTSSSNINKTQLLQGLLLEGAFQDLNPRSLLPYLEQFTTTAELQDFLDMANACILAAKEGRGKLIQNPHGFLFAQLRAGYLNPPEGYKSRKVRAQELRNRQLEEELTALRQLREQEKELQFELFKTALTAEETARLAQEVEQQVNPHIGLSPDRQREVHRDTILRQWFEQRGTQ